MAVEGAAAVLLPLPRRTGRERRWTLEMRAAGVGVVAVVLVVVVVEVDVVGEEGELAGVLRLRAMEVRRRWTRRRWRRRWRY